MRILVTGGAGFIGSHVCDTLLEGGHKVWIVDDLSTGFEENIPVGATFVQTDIRSLETARLFNEVAFDAVFHLAAQADVRKSVRDPINDLSINVEGSLRLLELCRRKNVNRFIFSSSGGAIYGEQDVFPAAEDHPQRPVSPYGVAKLAVERYMFFYYNEFGINSTALRYANVYGPRQNPFGEAGVVAIFTSKMLVGGTPIIWGDGYQTRDYVYVEDVARVNRLALTLDGFTVLNIGTGIETDVNTLFSSIGELARCKVHPQYKPQASGEQRRSCIDSTLAEQLLGWRPEVKLDLGLSKTVDYFRTLHADVTK